jgi:hypothetical protein
MSEIEKLLRKQTEWQKGRKELSWPEKIRMVEAIRDSILALRRTAVVTKSQRSRLDPTKH